MHVRSYQGLPGENRTPGWASEPPGTRQRDGPRHGPRPRGPACLPQVSHCVLLVLRSGLSTDPGGCGMDRGATDAPRRPTRLGGRSATVPLTAYQKELARLLSQNRTPDSYLAGGAALHIEPNSKRYSNALDYFHDSEQRVATACIQDRDLLEASGYQLEGLLNQPGFIRAVVEKDGLQTKVEWAHDSAWRFLPPVKNDISGYQLHPIDLAINQGAGIGGPRRSAGFPGRVRGAPEHPAARSTLLGGGRQGSRVHSVLPARSLATARQVPRGRLPAAFALRACRSGGPEIELARRAR